MAALGVIFPEPALSVAPRIGQACRLLTSGPSSHRTVSGFPRISSSRPAPALCRIVGILNVGYQDEGIFGERSEIADPLWRRSGSAGRNEGAPNNSRPSAVGRGLRCGARVPASSTLREVMMARGAGHFRLLSPTRGCAIWQRRRSLLRRPIGFLARIRRSWRRLRV